MPTETPSAGTIDSASPIILLANYAVLGPGQVLTHPRVQSRMLLWCRGGAGQVEVNGQAVELELGRVVLMPWQHDVRYRAAAGQALELGGVHLVPDLPTDAPLTFGIVHGPTSPLQDEAACRMDLDIPVLRQVVAGHWRQSPALQHLADYTVQWFRRGELDEATARQLGALHLREWQVFANSMNSMTTALPGELERLRGYIDRNLAGDLSIAQLAKVARCSRATLNRLFRRHLQTTPIRYVNDRRMDRAAALLERSSLTIAEVGAAVGMGDPSYFSKLFRQHRGTTCSAWRNRGTLYEI